MSSFVSRLFIGSLICFTAHAFAEKSYVSGTEHYRIAVNHIEGGGIGYNQGYTTLKAFLAPDPTQLSIMPFVDFRGHVFDDGKLAANAGIGIRGLSDCRVYGANIYYDYRKTKQQQYNQIGFGVETLGVRWDFRANGYLPVGPKTSSLYSSNTTSVTNFDSFQQNQALIRQTFTTKGKVQFAMTGVNIEAAFHILKNENIDLYVAGGPYYYQHSSKQSIGGQARVGARIYEYFFVEAINSYDSRFHENIQGSIGLTIPFGPRLKPSKSKKFEKALDPSLLAQRLVQDVQRQEIIVVDKTSKTTVSEVLSAAIDPLTGTPYFFVFVDNTSSSLGTYESPYPTFSLAEENSSPGDIIYVFPGDGTTTGMDSGITLQANQWLWGSNLNYSLESSLGTITIPAQSSSAPVITNTDIDTEGNAITLATNNTISGFIITSAANDAIYGADPQSLDVSSCTIENSNTYAIEASFSGDASISLMNNQFLDNVNGVFVALNGTSSLICSDNLFTDQTSVSNVPLEISADSNILTVTIENNLFSDNIAGSIRFSLNDAIDASINVVNNTMTNNGTGSQSSLASSFVIIPDGIIENCTIVLTDNIFSENASNSFYLHTSGEFTNLEITASANTMSGNNGSALVLATPVDTLTLVATENTISECNDNGIAIISYGSSLVGNITINDNNITDIGNLSNGIAINQDFSTLNLTVLNNEINRCEGTGIISYAPNGIDSLILNISGNTISNCENNSSNAAAGLDIEQYINFEGSVVNNTLSDNTGTAVFIGSTLLSPVACLTLTGNNSSTDYLLVNSIDGVFNLSPCDVDFVNVGIVNLSGIITPVQSCPDAAECY